MVLPSESGSCFFVDSVGAAAALGAAAAALGTAPAAGGGEAAALGAAALLGTTPAAAKARRPDNRPQELRRPAAWRVRRRRAATRRRRARSGEEGLGGGTFVRVRAAVRSAASRCLSSALRDSVLFFVQVAAPQLPALSPATNSHARDSYGATRDAASSYAQLVASNCAQCALPTSAPRVSPEVRRKSTCCTRIPAALAILALVLAVLVLVAILDAATAPCTSPATSRPDTTGAVAHPARDAVNSTAFRRHNNDKSTNPMPQRLCDRDLARARRLHEGRVDRSARSERARSHRARFWAGRAARPRRLPRRGSEQVRRFLEEGEATPPSEFVCDECRPWFARLLASVNVSHSVAVVVDAREELARVLERQPVRSERLGCLRTCRARRRRRAGGGVVGARSEEHRRAAARASARRRRGRRRSRWRGAARRAGAR